MKTLFLLALTLMLSAAATVVPDGPTPVVAVVTVDSPAAAVGLYGADRLPGVLDTLTAPYRGLRTFVVVDWRSASNTFEISAGATDAERTEALGHVAVAVVEASGVLAPGEAQGQAEAIRRRLAADYGGDVLFIPVALFPAESLVSSAPGGTRPLGPERPAVVQKGDLDPGVGVVFGGAWVLLVAAAVFGAGLAGAWMLGAWGWNTWRRRRTRKAWSEASGADVRPTVAGGAPVDSAALRERARGRGSLRVGRGSGDGVASGPLPSVTPSRGGPSSAELRRQARGATDRGGDTGAGSSGRPTFAVAAALLVAAGAVAQPVPVSADAAPSTVEQGSAHEEAGAGGGGDDGETLEAACLAADFVMVADVSGSTRTWADAARMLAPVVEAYDVTCVAVFGDSTRAVGVGADLAELRAALRDAPTDDYTRVADAFAWAGALARAARAEGRHTRIAVVSDFVDDDASGAVNAEFLPTLPPPSEPVEEPSPNAEEDDVEDLGGLPWLAGLAALLLTGGAWGLGRRSRRRATSVVVDLWGRTVQVYRGAEPVRVRPMPWMEADGLRPMTLALDERGVVMVAQEVDAGLPVDPSLRDLGGDSRAVVRPAY